MPTNRRRVGRQPIRGQVPPGALWWLEHGRSPGLPEAATLGLTEADVWIASNLHYDRPTAGWLSRATLRELGYGAQIDQHIADGRCPSDGWRSGCGESWRPSWQQGDRRPAQSERD